MKNEFKIGDKVMVLPGEIIGIDGNGNLIRCSNGEIIRASNDSIILANEKGNTMSTITDRGKKAIVRTSGRKITKTTKSAIIKALQSKGADNTTVSFVSSFLETELGTGLVSELIGILLPQIPKINTDPRVQMMAEEFQVEGLATMGNALLDEMLKFSGPVIEEVMASLSNIDKESKEETKE